MDTPKSLFRGWDTITIARGVLVEEVFDLFLLFSWMANGSLMTGLTTGGGLYTRGIMAEATGGTWSIFMTRNNEN